MVAFFLFNVQTEVIVIHLLIFFPLRVDSQQSLYQHWLRPSVPVIA